MNFPFSDAIPKSFNKKHFCDIFWQKLHKNIIYLEIFSNFYYNFSAHEFFGEGYLLISKPLGTF